MKKETPRTRRSLLNFVRGGSLVSPRFDDEPPAPARVWANAAELLNDEFGFHTA